MSDRTRRDAALLVLASCTVLVQELALIRWLPSQVRVLAYFPNLILLASFLGLGVGCLRAGARSVGWLWPAAVALVVAAGRALAGVAFTHEGRSDHLFLLYYDLGPSAPVVNDIRLPVLLCFVLVAVAFVPAGQVVAELLNGFQRRGEPLRGYRWDLTGSVLGVVLFTLLGLLGTRPVVWFGAFLLGTAVLVPARRGVAAAVSLVILALVGVGDRTFAYSPYYGISWQPAGNGVEVLVNGSLHQRALPMARAQPADAGEAHIREGYHLPHRLLKQPPRRALVIGAGTGNDVAVLLDEGAGHVDAVEIDPVILRVGKALHPSRPYDSPRVTVINTDARAWLQRALHRYDLIVFGTLDSMTRLSALSNVRLDEFVYTRDSLKAAQRLLTPEGGLVLYFMAAGDEIDIRLGGMILDAFREVPAVRREHRGLFNVVFMAGPAFAHVDDGAGRRAAAAATQKAVRRLVGELPSDDWPYLYSGGRALSQFHVTMSALLLLVSVSAVALASRSMRDAMRSRTADVPMFLLGLGFLLLETRSVTQMNLVWGATWLTSAVVFASILLMVLVGTLVVERVRVPPLFAAAGLAVSLLAVWLTPPAALVGQGTGLRLASSAALVGLPMLFASLCFSQLYAAREDAPLAFGWNLLGAVAGGLLEALSVVIGLADLVLLALLAYALVALLEPRRQASLLAPAAARAEA